MEELLKYLENLGFTVYESKVFMTLFEGHMLSGSDVAKKADIPRSSAYDILKQFVKKGICNEIQTSSVIKYEIVDPAIVQDKLEKEISDSFKFKMNNLKSSFDRLQPIFQSRELEGQKVDVELLKGFNKHRYSKQQELFKQSEKELLMMTKLEGHVSDEADERVVEFIKNGGKVRTLYEVSSKFKLNIDGEWKELSTDEMIEFCQTLAAEGEEIRLIDKINQNMAIFDRKTVYLSLVDPTISRYNRSDIIVKNENYAATMAEYFEVQWTKALTPEEFKNRRNK
jgi:sugar-specific transcriptional regulator TrmB